MRNTILGKVILIILSTVILSAVLTALIFSYTGGMAFSRIKAQEMEPRAKYLADVTADYFEGRRSLDEYGRAIGSQYRIWDAFVYIYDADGELFVRPDMEGSEKNVLALSSLIPTVLNGSSVTMPSTANSVGVVVGEPVVSSYDNVIGAVFLIKPLSEVNTAMVSLLVSLMVSMLAVIAVMILPAYFSSRSLVNPLRQMSGVANAMARGDFSIKAYDGGKDEVSQLGSALNELSNALSKTISDLMLEKNRLRAMIDGLGEGIVALSYDGSTVCYNAAAVRLMGGTDGMAPDSLQMFTSLSDELKQTIVSGKPYTHETKSDDVTLRFTMTPLANADGCNSGGAVMLIQDVSESARLEQTRRDYVANVSHELRTPISSIRSLADALNDGLVKKEEDRLRYYGYLIRESMRLSRLIDDLLELSRLQSGSIALKKGKLDINELVFETSDRFTEQISSTGRSVSVSVPDEAYAYTNPDRVEQVLIILADNAVKHGSGDISIDVTDCGDEYTVCVSNDGSISKADLEHVFDRFYKADKSHSGGGTGLGLSIASEVTALLGEKVFARSEGGRVVFGFTLEKYKK